MNTLEKKNAQTSLIIIGLARPMVYLGIAAQEFFSK